MPSAVLSALLLAAGAAPPAGMASPEQLVATLYAPYAARDFDQHADDAIWSAETGALVRRWKHVTPADEIDDLGDFDWLCHCQDWDRKAFRATVTGKRPLRPGLVSVQVRLALGASAQVSERLVLRREGPGWRVDDIFASDLPHGLKQALRTTIAADLRRKQP